MKKGFLKFASLLVAVAILCVALVGCAPTVAEGECLIVIAAYEENVKEYKVNLNEENSGEGLFSVLEYLKENEGLTYVAQESTYGAYLLEIGDVKPDSTKGEYVKLYTSVESDFDTSAYFEETEYKGIKLGTAGVGASSMKLEGGAIYYITKGSY